MSGAVQTIKGCAFVIGTAVFLYLGLRTQVRKVEQGEIERLEVLDALKERERELSLIANHLPGLVSHFDRDLRYQFANDGYERWFGISPGDVVGRTVPEVIGEDAFRRSESLIRRALAGESVTFENSFTTVAGETVHGQVTFVPDHDDRGRVDGLIALVTDVTARKEAEESLRELNAHLEQRVADRTEQLAAKSRELESFCYSVSHDLKAPLRGIDGYSRLLLEDYKDRLDGDGLTFLRNVRDSAQQMTQLIEDLLAYSKLERRGLQAGHISLTRAIEACLAERRADLAGVNVAVDVAEHCVMADREGLAVVLRNLIDNAIKFSRGRTPPEIAITARVEDAVCILTIRDNGTGFDMRYYNKIFEIFQRLHRMEDFPGTGIGLALVKKAMERMNGSVRAESSPGEGAAFHLEFPVPQPQNPVSSSHVHTSDPAC